MYRIEVERKKLGLSQHSLAKKAGLERVLVNKIERGAIKAYPKYREALAAAICWEGDPKELFEEVPVDTAASVQL